jgi:hypothetical protein
MIRAVAWWESIISALADGKVFVVATKQRQGGYISRSSFPDGFHAAVEAILNR